MKEEIKITKEDLVMWLDRPPSDDDFDLCSYLAKAVENQKKYYEENKSLQSQLKEKEEVIKEASNRINKAIDEIDKLRSLNGDFKGCKNLLEILSKGENK